VRDPLGISEDWMRGWDGMAGMLTFIVLILLRSTRPISILMRGFLLLGREGAVQGAEEVEV